MARPLFHLLIVGALAATGLAATPEDPELSDPCGDSHTGVDTGDERIEAPPTRDDHADLRAVWFEQEITDDGVLEAVRVHLEVCGEVPPEPEDWSSFSAWWRLDDGCTLRLGLDSALHAPAGPGAEFRREATYRKSCPADGLTPFDTSSEVVFEVPIDDAVGVDGSRVTWSLSPDDLPADAAATMRPGTLWRGPSGQAGQFGGSTVSASGVYAQVAPTTDYGVGGRDVVIGGSQTSTGNSP